MREQDKMYHAGPHVPIILGIETSCDETAAALVTADRRVLSDVVLSQWEAHQHFGGVVPEIAARAHLDHVDAVIAEAMTRAGLTFHDLSGVAVTGGPGLIGGVMVGVMTAQAIALVHNLPLMAVNHLEGHALTARLSDNVAFPYLLLLVSGGHCQVLVVEGVGRYHRLGGTIDDAAGEAFDKVAKMLNLGMPGGPAVERAAERSQQRGQQRGQQGGQELGRPINRFPLPRPLLGRAGCDFSFSGLKTAVRQAVEALPAGPLDPDTADDLAASFQATLVASILERLGRGVTRFKAEWPEGQHLVVAGGVAANSALRTGLQSLAAAHGLTFVAPPARWCTDNAAMIAWAGVERLALGLTDGLDFRPRPRWPLDDRHP